MPRWPRRSGEALNATLNYARQLQFLAIGLFAVAITMTIGAMAAAVLLKPLAHAGTILG
jgi:hypothetical protein